MILPTKICKAEVNFPKLSVINTKFLSSMVEEKLNLLFILSIENEQSKSMQEKMQRKHTCLTRSYLIKTL